MEFTVPVGTYTVVETDLVGWGSSTPNAVDVTLLADGDTQLVEFGDMMVSGTGTLRGLVYNDLDGDGLFSTGEPGISDVPVTVVGQDSVVTDGNGNFQLPSAVSPIVVCDPPW